MKNTVIKLAADLSFLLLMVTVFTWTAQANPPSTVPEVDPTSMVTAVTVLAAGWFITVSRLRRK
jgi:hypothetical protein